MHTLFRNRSFQRLNVFKSYIWTFAKKNPIIMNKKTFAIMSPTLFLLTDYTIINKDVYITQGTTVGEVYKKATDIEIIRLINMLDWSNKDVIIKSKTELLIDNIDKLNIETIAKCIFESDKFAEEFAKYILKTQNIKLYQSVSDMYPSINNHIFEQSDKNIQFELADFLFFNINKNDPHAYKNIIFSSPKFCNLLANEILTNDGILNKLDSLRIKCMLSRLEPDIKIKIFTMILEKIHTCSDNVITGSLEEGCKMIDGESYSVKLSKLVCEKKFFDLLKKLNAYHFHFLMDDIHMWSNFVLKNLFKVVEINKDLIDHVTDNKYFCKSLINLMKKRNFVLINSNCEVLKNLYKNVNIYYKFLLQNLYFDHRTELANIDLYVIIRHWDINFVKKLIDALIDEGNTDFFSDDIFRELDYKDTKYARGIYNKVHAYKYY
jgi:hypothetical protein